MKLINDLFHIVTLEQGDGALRCSVRLNAAHPIYAAHFPNNPITPGVCLMQMATEILQQQRGRALQIDSISRIKFKKAITPDQQPTFVFTKVEEDGDALSVKAHVEVDGSQLVTLSLKYQTAN